MPDIYLQTARREKGWSQAELGRRANVGQKTISNLENDPHASPSYTTQIAIADALGVDDRDLRFGPPPKKRIKR